MHDRTSQDSTLRLPVKNVTKRNAAAMSKGKIGKQSNRQLHGLPPPPAAKMTKTRRQVGFGVARATTKRGVFGPKRKLSERRPAVRKCVACALGR